MGTLNTLSVLVTVQFLNHSFQSYSMMYSGRKASDCLSPGFSVSIICTCWSCRFLECQDWPFGLLFTLFVHTLIINTQDRVLEL